MVYDLPQSQTRLNAISWAAIYREITYQALRQDLLAGGSSNLCLVEDLG